MAGGGAVAPGFRVRLRRPGMTEFGLVSWCFVTFQCFRTGPPEHFAPPHRRHSGARTARTRNLGERRAHTFECASCTRTQGPTAAHMAPRFRVRLRRPGMTELCFVRLVFCHVSVFPSPRRPKISRHLSTVIPDARSVIRNPGDRGAQLFPQLPFVQTTRRPMAEHAVLGSGFGSAAPE